MPIGLRTHGLSLLRWIECYLKVSPSRSGEPGVSLNICDTVVKVLGLSSVVVLEAGVTSTSRGLVGDTVFAVLPNVAPWHTFTATVLFQAVHPPSSFMPRRCTLTLKIDTWTRTGFSGKVVARADV